MSKETVGISRAALPYVDVTHPRYAFKGTKPRRMQSLEDYVWHEFRPSGKVSNIYIEKNKSSEEIIFQMDEKVANLLVCDSVFRVKGRLVYPNGANGAGNDPHDPTSANYQPCYQYVTPKGGSAGICAKPYYRVNERQIKRGDDYQQDLNVVRLLTSSKQTDKRMLMDNMVSFLTSKDRQETKLVSTSPSYGTVTQITDIDTGVTLNTSSGQITTVAAATASGVVEAGFTVTCDKVSSDDTVQVSVASYVGAGIPTVFVGVVADGTFTIKIGNAGGDALDSVVVIAFRIIPQAGDDQVEMLTAPKHRIFASSKFNDPKQLLETQLEAYDENKVATPTSGQLATHGRLHLRSSEFDVPMRDLVELYQYTDKLSKGATHYMRMTLADFNNWHVISTDGRGTPTPDDNDGENGIYFRPVAFLIESIVWWVPSVDLNALAMKNLVQSVRNLPNLSYTMPFKHWEYYRGTIVNGTSQININVTLPGMRPSHIIFGVHSAGHDSDLTKDGHKFTAKWSATEYISKLNLRFNGRRVMQTDYDLTFGDLPNSHSKGAFQAYDDFVRFAGKDLMMNTLIPYEDWAEDYPLFVFDLTKVSRSKFDPNQSSNQILIEGTLSAALSAGNQNCAIVGVYDKALQVDFKNDRMFYRDAPIQP